MCERITSLFWSPADVILYHQIFVALASHTAHKQSEKKYVKTINRVIEQHKEEQTELSILGKTFPHISILSLSIRVGDIVRTSATTAGGFQRHWGACSSTGAVIGRVQ